MRLGSGGRVSLFNGSPGSVQMLADVAGYYLTGTGTQAGTFTPIAPVRLLDTRPTGVAAMSRTSVGTAKSAPLAAGSYDAAVLNVTAVAPKAPGGDGEVSAMVLTDADEVDADLVGQHCLLDEIADHHGLRLRNAARVRGHVAEGIQTQFQLSP